MTITRVIERCPLCERRELGKYLSAKDPDSKYNIPFTLLRCNLCDFVFLKEIPIQDGLYDGLYYKLPNAATGGLFDLVLDIFISSRVKLVRKYKKEPGRVLDIGCGDGAFLSGMKKAGWQVFGIDSSKSAREYCEGRGIITLGKEFLDAPVQDENLDVITYWYSLEHMLEPLAYLKRTHRALKRDGILIIAVQNIESMQAAYAGKKWFHLDLPRHTLHFSPKTLAMALGERDFEIIDIEHSSLQMNIFGWYQSILNMVDVQPNFFYNLLKRGRIDRRKALISLMINIVVSPLALPLAIGLAKLEETRKRGGVITAIAKKRI